MARILIHSLIFKPDGVSTAYLYADLVSELKKLGHEIEVITTTPHYNIIPSDIQKQPLKRKNLFFYQSIYDGVPVYHIPMTKSKFVLKRMVDFVKFHILTLCSTFFIRKFDIVLAPSPPLTIGVISCFLARLKGGKAIYNVQEIYPDFAINQGVLKNGFMIKVLKSVERYVYNRSAAVVTIDDKFSGIIKPRIVDQQKLSIIPNFVDTTLYVPGERHNSFSAQYGLDDKFVITYAGNIGYAQNWNPIVFAAEKLRHLPVVFLILGDGVMKPWLKETIAAKQLENILLLDYQPRELMPQINAAADVHTIVMNAGTDAEGFPSKIYSILSSARPVIVSTGDNSPLGCFLKKADCRRVVPLDDNEAYAAAVLKAYEEKNLLQEEGNRGRVFVEQNYSKEAVALKYHQLINSLC
ncbi:glycosyltransferase family 4 protein [Chitinophaga solisilvae]|uniref:glycosyltransferase family 4 protein n=1 Tax=Chitinophaga solisilvae TaxID=1233460 RepID=UPI0013705851|nr:glycosyltransferase family 4 protein [Chitinophaga solisilvae]